MSLDRRFVTISIPELNYLLLNLTVLVNQLPRYKMADPDVVE
jgi:DNA-directed RNA polymerase subunit H (RpoH/RPB5)